MNFLKSFGLILSTVFLNMQILAPNYMQQAVGKQIATNQQQIVINNVPCATPPSTFDPLTSSDASIAAYRLPRRPQNGQGLDIWVNMIKGIKHSSCANATYTTSANSANINMGIPNDTNTTCTGDCYWSGYVTYPPQPTLVQRAYGYFHPACDFSGDFTHQVVSWVGIGGESSNLLQAGVETDTHVSYLPSFFWEIMPGSQIQLISYQNIKYNCGDEAYAYVDFDYTVPGSGNYILVTDKTTGQSYNLYFYGFTPSLQTADWIDERPSCRDNIGNYALANFGVDQWSGYYWTTSYQFYSIGGGGGAYLQQIYYNDNIAAPGQLYTDGTHPLGGFKDYWEKIGYPDHPNC